MTVVKHISGPAGGYLVGNSHANGGIKAINKAIGKPLEMEGGEVVITKPAVDDGELREFEGQMLTNRQILSKINESGGGISFAELGAELPTEVYLSGLEYKFGGETLSDYEITNRISKCGCQHEESFETGGVIYNRAKVTTGINDGNEFWRVTAPGIDEIGIFPKNIYSESNAKQVFEEKHNLFTHNSENKKDIPKGRLEDISLLIDLQRKKQLKQPTQYDINLIKNAFYNKIKKLPIVESTVILDYLTELEKAAGVKPIFSSNHKIWENYINQITDSNESAKPKYGVGSVVKYSTGDVEIEKWIGIVDEVKDFGTEYAYRINAYTTNLENPMLDSAKTNEKYEGSLSLGLKSVYEKAKADYERYKNLHHAASPIIELSNGDKNHVSSQLFEYTGQDFISGEFYNIEGNVMQLDTGRPFFHKETGKKFVVVNNSNEKLELKISNYKNPYEINRAIEKFLDSVDDDTQLSPEQKEFISHYSGYGGLEKFGSFSDNELKGLLYEYFTPDEIVKKMWALAYKFGFGIIQNPSIMEPSVGTGNFLKYAPLDCSIYGNEINGYSKRICEILYPKAQIALQPFEKNFISRNLSVKGKIENLPKHDLVIGNPPYGQAMSKYISMGEGDYTKARNFTEYFISRGLDLLKPGGLLIFVVGAEQYNGGTLFLDGGISEVKRNIAEKAQLMDAYRLPTKIFERTGVASEILVFKKN